MAEQGHGGTETVRRGVVRPVLRAAGSLWYGAVLLVLVLVAIWRGVVRPVLRAIGSLWYAAVLLVLVLVAMACATVFESTHGTERALALFYQSRWFEILLALLAVNVLAAVIVRFPFTRRQIGFMLTHASVLIMLIGAVVTARYGIDGQVGIAEGQTVKEFSLRGADTLTVLNRLDAARAALDLTSRDFHGFSAVDDPRAPAVTLGELRIEVERYLPDSEVSERVVNDNPHTGYALEVSLSESGRGTPTWVFADEPTEVGSHDVLFRVIHDEKELARMVSAQPADEARTEGTVRIEHGSATFDIPLEECRETPVPVGDTGYAARVTRYLPHATVGPDNKLVNASDKPINPAIEVELSRSKDKEMRLAFSRFPQFGSIHGEGRFEDIKVTFVAPNDATPEFAIELLAGPGGDLYARFAPGGKRVLTQKLTVGVPVESPWPLQRFAVLRRFDHARTERSVVPREPREKGRVPAVLVKLTDADRSNSVWVRKWSRPVRFKGGYELVYGNKALPLGFSLTLNDFHIGYYPGTGRPRSFESHVTVVDPALGGEQSRVISMNNPAKFGGYSLFQSSYRQEGTRLVSFLSVSRDPGLPIVFTGYIGMMAGMFVVLGTRITEGRRTLRVPTAGASTGRARPSGRNAGPDGNLQAQVCTETESVRESEQAIAATGPQSRNQ